MRKIQKISIVGGTVGVLMAGGIAYAAWTSEGTGSGTVTAGSQTGLVVSDNTAVDNLFPSKSVTFPVTVTNNNPYDVKIRSLQYNDAKSSTNKAGCGVGNVDVIIDDAVGDTIDANGTSDAYTATVTMDADAATQCQGATFDLKFDASADSNTAG